MTGRLAGATAALLGVLAGAWLVLAPFALGVQNPDADWTDETWTDVGTGAGLVLVGAVGLIAFAAALHRHLVERGLITPRPKHVAITAPEPAAPAPAVEPGGDAELKALLAPLVTALTQDLERDRHDGRQQPATHYRREAL